MPNTATRLADAVACQLNRDFACHRGKLFGESYLQFVVADVLASLVLSEPAEVRSEYPLEVAIGKAGRRRVDFVLYGLQRKQPLVAVEVKWAASGHCSPTRALQDVLRLASMDPQPAEAILLVAGPREALAQRLNERPFIAASGRFSLSSAHRRRRTFASLARSRRIDALLRKSAKDVGLLGLPQGIETMRFESLMRPNEQARFDAICWTVRCVGEMLLIESDPE